MQLIRGLHNLKELFVNGCVSTIGNYDGVHLGHQQILDRLKEKSKELNIPSVVIIFFTKNKILKLTSLREKISLFKKYNIDFVLIFNFNSDFYNITAENFARKILVERLNIKYLVIGDDFSFGYKREGNFSLLNKWLRVEEIPSFKIDGVRISSSFIRNALMRGDLKIAAKFLGRPYSISGRVIHGDHFGREICFPTANIHLAGYELPLEGVFSVKINGLVGIANIGFRPTVLGKHKSFEVHILNFNTNIYGKLVEIEFCKKIRDEQKFESIEALRLQISKDLENLNDTT